MAAAPQFRRLRRSVEPTGGKSPSGSLVSGDPPKGHSASVKVGRRERQLHQVANVRTRLAAVRDTHSQPAKRTFETFERFKVWSCFHNGRKRSPHQRRPRPNSRISLPRPHFRCLPGAPVQARRQKAATGRISGLRMSAIWNPSQEAARGQERPLTYADTMAATNLEETLATSSTYFSFRHKSGRGQSPRNALTQSFDVVADLLGRRESVGRAGSAMPTRLVDVRVALGCAQCSKP